MLATLDVPGEVVTPLGYGFDIGGAVLIGMAIWSRATDLVHRTEELQAFLNGIHDRIRVVVGIPFIATGFAFQLVGSTWGGISPPADLNALAIAGAAMLSIVAVAATTVGVRNVVRGRTLKAALERDDTSTSNLVCNACRKYWPKATTAIENAIHDPLVPNDSGMPKDVGLRNAAIVQAVRDGRLPP